MDIETNKFYTTTEVLNIFGISERTYYRRREEFDEYLELYFDYRAWNDGVRSWYVFIEQYEEEVPPFKHKRKAEKAVDNTILYMSIIDKEVERNPLFSANSLANDLFTSGLLPSDHSVRTARRYIMTILKSDKYATSDPVWCKKVWNPELSRMEYQPMVEEEVQEYKQLVRSLANLNDDIELRQKFYDGYISPDEYFKKNDELWKKAFKGAKEVFYKKYNYTPRTIRPVVIRAF